MNNIPSELLVAGGIALALLAAIILVKFGKQILTVLLVIGGIAVIGLLVWGWAQVQKPDLIPGDTREAISDVADIARVLKPDEPSQVYSAPQPEVQYVPQRASSGIGWLCAGVMGTLLAIGGCVGAYVYVRAKVLPQKSKQPRHPDVPVVYILSDDDEYDDAPVDFDEQWIGSLFQ